MGQNTIQETTQNTAKDTAQNTVQDTAHERVRYHLLDSFRGVVILMMITYHAVWDIVNLYGVDWNFFETKGSVFVQQTICWAFILLSGFCWSLGHKPLKRGLLVFGAGLLVTAVTLAVMPENRVVFGVLTLLGSCMLILIPLDKWLKKLPSEMGAAISFLLFVLTYNVNSGFLGFGSWNLTGLPKTWYHGLAAAYLGFMPRGFFSTDYFSLFPWLFLFMTGYFLFGIAKKRNWLHTPFLTIKVPFLSFVGKHSLLIYLLHQPVLYIMGELIW